MNSIRWDKNEGTSGNKSYSHKRGKKKSNRKLVPKPHETEEEAIIRRFHDAQRMARFRAKRKKALEEVKGKDVKFDIANSIVTVSEVKEFQSSFHGANPPIIVQTLLERNNYSQLLAVIEELGRDVRLTYAGSKTSAEKVKVGITKARMLVKHCLLEIEINSHR